MSGINNPTDPFGVIILDEEGTLERVVPEEIPAKRTETVRWVVVPPNHQVEVAFDGPTGSPLNWQSEKTTGGKLEGTVSRDAKEEENYKYTVTDDHGNKMDPRVRVKR